jgi:CDP-glucose 4,6-dehydratase
MAAQSLVRPSYDNPVDTFSRNVMGTLHVLEACRQTDSVEVIINVTSDKCYENQEWVWGYRESDPMGGHDPYSCSKGCSELVTSSYRRSFMQTDSGQPRQLASVRAGNVIGGGDWATDRIVPDIMRALTSDKSPEIRNPGAIRPWQHVLEPLHGYLILAQAMSRSPGLDEGWNFGPDDSNTVSVSDLYQRILKYWPSQVDFQLTTKQQPHEASLLKLDCSKAKARLGWRPLLSLDGTAEWTAEWYQAWHQQADPLKITLAQIRRYQALTELHP